MGFRDEKRYKNVKDYFLFTMSLPLRPIETLLFSKYICVGKFNGTFQNNCLSNT